MGKVKDAVKRAKDAVTGGGEKNLSRKSSNASLKSNSSKKSARGNELANPEILSKKDRRKLAKEQEQNEDSDESDDEDFEDASEGEDVSSDEEEERIDGSKLLESDSESDEDLTVQKSGDEEEEDEEDVPLSDVELDEDADVVPYEKTTINNTAALKQSFNSIKLPTSKLPFFEHLTVESDGPIVMKDIYDDMEREMCFYKQGMDAVFKARKQLLKDKVPFSRPTDYFAEMVKSDEHMDRLKKKLVDEESNKKASQEAKRQRELKKFGKKVQNAKLQERAKEKRDTLDKIKSLKRKRPGLTTDTDFDVAIEEAASTEKERSGPKVKGQKRLSKDSKFGNGGKKRFKKSNDAQSSMDMSGFNQKKMKAGAQKSRPGKSKRNKK